MDDKYNDIINLPHYQSKKRPHMSIYDRAAQFSPFAALTGHDEAIKETARLTDKKTELSETTKTILDEKFSFIMEHIYDQPEITVTYFIPDTLKSGGMYVDFTGRVKKYDYHNRILHFTDNTEIKVDDIMEIESEIFPKVFDMR
ncbi:MAG: hypothetical protein IKC45_02705 [Clostridia bacterium]|nr:hypothetical protein [Clostridia bacterium]